MFALLENDSFPVLRISDGDVVPFWSSRSRVDRVRQEHAKYEKYQVEEITLGDFFAKTLPLLDEEHIRVGVNWSGSRLTGYDASAAEVRANLMHHLKQEL